MGKEQLTKVPVQHLSFGTEQLHTHITQGQSLHILAVLTRRFQRNQAAHPGDNGMPQLLCHGIAVTGGAGGGIGQAAGGQDHPAGRYGLLLGFYALHPALSRQDLPNPGSFHCHIFPPQLSLQAVQNRNGFIRYREHPIAPLCFQRAAVGIKEFHDSFRRKSRQCTEQESPIAGNVLQDLLCRAVIGHIAAALSGDQQFLAQAAVALQQKYTLSLLGCRNGSKHSRRAAADDNSIKFHFFLHLRKKRLPSIYSSVCFS